MVGGATFDIKCDPVDSIMTVKEMIEAAQKIPSNEQSLGLAGGGGVSDVSKSLNDPTKTLEECGVKVLPLTLHVLFTIFPSHSPFLLRPSLLFNFSLTLLLRARLSSISLALTTTTLRKTPNPFSQPQCPFAAYSFERVK